jgi:hypothetical protein
MASTVAAARALFRDFKNILSGSRSILRMTRVSVAVETDKTKHTIYQFRHGTIQQADTTDRHSRADIQTDRVDKTRQDKTELSILSATPRTVLAGHA